MKVLIVGGVAGGASAAARLRRNDEHAQIILFERGEYISFANCGLPYYIGGVINDREKLTLQTPESFYERFQVEVRVRNEVLSIDKAKKAVTVRDLKNGSVYEESYDKLILAPGAEPVRPNIPGARLDRVFTLRTIPDTLAIREYCEVHKPRSAVVVGGGYIGVETAENLHKLGLSVTIVEMAGHIIPPIDEDVAAEVQNHIRSKGVGLILSTGVTAIEEQGGVLAVKLSNGQSIDAGIVILSAGVRPESRLAEQAGLTLGVRGCIAVDETMRTSDEDIYAVGDAVEVTDIAGGGKAFLPLASPANKQGRIVADVLTGRPEEYEGSQGSSVLKVFDMTVAMTGNSETALRRRGIEYRKSFTYSPSNASYYPGGLPMSIKLLFTPDGKRILGAQAAGYSGVDKRIDVIATAMRLNAGVKDLTKLELCYAPPFSSAKDPVNMAGYTAGNILDGAMTPFYPEDVAGIDPTRDVLLDVRTEEEFEAGTIEGAVNFPLDSLRGELSRLPKDKTLWVFCQIGLRGYVASRILTQNGFTDVRNLSGGYRLWKEIEKNRLAVGAPAEAAEPAAGKAEAPASGRTIDVDACGLSCPGPILSVHKAMEQASPGDVLKVTATDPAFSGDIEAWCRRTGNSLLASDFDGKKFSVTIRKGIGLSAQKQASGGNEKSMVVFSGDLDKAIAAFIIANGAASMGRKVHMFFTFWGLNVLRRPEKVSVTKDFISRMFGAMMPKGSRKLGLSRMNMGGMGAKMIRAVMNNKNISSLEDLMRQAITNGVEITACAMSMDVMGIRREELIDGVQIGGVASFLASAEDSDTTLFI